MLRSVLLTVGVVTLGTFAMVGDTKHPHPIPADKAGIGRSLGHLEFVSIDGKGVRLAEVGKGKPVVIALTGTTCPLAKKYGPTLAALEDQFAKEGVAFVFVNPAEQESAQDVKADVQRLGLNGPYVHDGMNAAALGAKTTTEVFVLNAERTLVYRGAVDDQYGIGYAIDKPRKTYLVDALKATLAGKTPPVPATWAPGCVLEAPSAEETPVTYHGRIAHIVQKYCLDCHRKGGVAPFILETYNDVKARASMLKYAVEKGIMPPWFASKQTPGPWKNDRSLSDAERAAFAQWIDAGTPAGDPKEGPKPPMRTSQEWAIGKPDAVFQIPSAFDVNATGVMPYQIAYVETTFDEDKWVDAMEVQPTDRSVVHHVLIFVRPKGMPRNRVNLGEELSGFFAAYVPGNDHVIYPSGFAKMLPKGSTLKFQIHYTPNGRATTDQTRLAIRFAKGPVKHEVKTIGIANLFIRIPPGADNHKETAIIPEPNDVRVLSFIPHMHVRGKAARYEWVKPNGERETLLDVPRYDFNWQISYEYAEPKLIPKGSRLEFSAWFDNSDKNPANPDPTKTVRWGSQTFDEMHLGYVEYYVPGMPVSKE